MRTTQKERKDDRLIEVAYRKMCSGIAINVMDISKVFKVGHAAIANGKQGEELEQAIYDFVQTIRCDS